MDDLARAHEALKALGASCHAPSQGDLVVDLDSGIVGRVVRVGADGRVEMNCGIPADEHGLRVSTTPARVAAATRDMEVWSVEADFRSEGESYGYEMFRVVAPDEAAAHALGLGISTSSRYDDDRIPDRVCTLLVSPDEAFEHDLEAEIAQEIPAIRP